MTLASGFNLETYGVLNGAATLFAIAPGTGGVLTTPASGGSLYLTTHGINTDTQGAHNGISVTAPINDNGGAVTLVKSGVGVLQLNVTSSYSGGMVLNSGILWPQTDASLGNVNGDITFDGSATLLLSPNNGTSALTFTLPATRSIIVNNGAMATIAGGRANATVTVNGDISGSGGVTLGRVALLSSGGVGTVYNFNLLGNNTFTGEFGVGNGQETSAGGQLGGVTINTLADSTSPITLNFGSGAYFSLGSTATANLSVPNRLVDLRNSNITIRNQDANNTITLGSVSTTTTGAKELKLGDGGAGGFITGNITDGNGAISVTKSGTGTWTLSGTNTYTGVTTIGGTAIINTLKNYGVACSLGAPTSGDIIFNKYSVDYLVYVGSGDTANRTIRLEDDVSNRNSGSGIYNNGTGALIFNGSTFNTPYVSSGNTGHTPILILGGTFAGSANEIRGVIADNQFSSNSRFAITKNADASIWKLSGANTYTGATAINGGKLIMSTAGSGKSAISIANTVGCVFGVQLAVANGQWASSSTLTVGGANSQIEIDYGNTTPTTSSAEAPVKVTTLTVSGVGTIKILCNDPNQFTVGQTYPLINGTTAVPVNANPYIGLNLSLPAGMTGHLVTVNNYVQLVVDSLPPRGTLIQFMVE